MHLSRASTAARVARGAARRAATTLARPPHRRPGGVTAAAAASGAAAPASAPPSQAPRDKFDLPTAVALAAAAFESYLQPSPYPLKTAQLWAPAKTPANDDGSFPRDGGAVVTFTDPAFLRATYAGVLELRILSASGLRAVNTLGGASDPFVVATLPKDGGCVATPVARGTCDPVWWRAAEENGGAPASPSSRTHTLYVRDDPRVGAPADPESSVRVAVYDRAMVLGSDEALGAAAVAVRDFLAPPSSSSSSSDNPTASAPPFIRKALPLRGRDAQGTVVVEGRFLPFAEAGQPPSPATARAEDFVAADGPALPEPSPNPQATAATTDLAAAAASAASGAKAAAASAAEEAIKEAQEMLVGGDGKSKSGGGGGLFGGAAALLDSARQALGKTKKEAQVGAAAPPPPPPPPPPPADPEALEKARREQQEMAEAWRAVTRAAGRVMHASAAAAAGKGDGRQDQGADYSAVAFIESLTTDTEAWVGRSLSAREVVVAFRGTETSSLKDVLSDLNAVPVALEEGRARDPPAVEEEAAQTNGGNKKDGADDEVLVHRGFLQAWDSVRPRVLSAAAAAVLSVQKENNSPAPVTLYVCGHSLGGALATLCAFDLTSGRSSALPGVQPGSFDVAMYTYGAPRVGNGAFARAFTRRMRAVADAAEKRGGGNLQAAGAAFRILNQRDLVPTVPRLMGYAHVPYGVRLPAATEAGGVAAREAATEAAASAVAGALEEEEGVKGDDGAAAARRAGAALDALEQFLVFEDEDGLDPLGEGRDISGVVADAADAAASAIAKEGLSLGALSKAADAAASAVGGADLMSAEFDLVASLMDGTAVTDHLEPSYLGRLVAALQAAGVEVPEALRRMAGGAEADDDGKEEEDKKDGGAA